MSERAAQPLLAFTTCTCGPALICQEAFDEQKERMCLIEGAVGLCFEPCIHQCLSAQVKRARSATTEAAPKETPMGSLLPGVWRWGWDHGHAFRLLCLRLSAARLACPVRCRGFMSANYNVRTRIQAGSAARAGTRCAHLKGRRITVFLRETSPRRPTRDVGKKLSLLSKSFNFVVMLNNKLPVRDDAKTGKHYSLGSSS